MRQVGDTLIWLGLIMVVTAVVYYTPRLANRFTGAEAENFTLSVAARPIAARSQPIASHHTFHSVVDLPH
jgi:hypothetical protein